MKPREPVLLAIDLGRQRKDVGELSRRRPWYTLAIHLQSVSLQPVVQGAFQSKIRSPPDVISDSDLFLLFKKVRSSSTDIERKNAF